MKYFFVAVALVFAFSQMVAAQTAACAAQNVLDTCLSNEDNYLKTCIDRDYACLCKWHTAKLTCFDNCPQNLGRASQQGLKDTFCSIAQTYNNITSSSIAPSSTPSATAKPSNNVVSIMPSVPSSNSTSTSTSMSISNLNYLEQSLFMLIATAVTFSYLI
ncbi:uncharacterized protein BX663DRAFT_548711 [Cokeromyces recurvatus]|uniref:uncharacterized protein n=1 Tax=Cokeromyces recurvatus TaxID=90255 RepID=UPI00221F2BE2|nr:uncharacterized protein BX663DRAFT_548711 [Cokeromyces recurvatus]KAI7906543.1 hypothetical protein BX663DRAFT_548711 [Cokeromyces recurvatus]